MIISHEHQFIFLKTAKTAGTSIEIALSRVCGPDDVITPIPPEDEELRRRAGGRGPQHHLAPPWQYSAHDLYRLARARKPAQRYYNHISAAEVRPQLDDGTWSSYFTFCFERNPWERALSFYFWQRRKRPDLTLDDVLFSDRVNELRRTGRDIYMIDGEVVVDRVCRYEAIGEELGAVVDRLGLAIDAHDLPQAKAGYRTDQRHYRDIYTDRQRDRVAELFGTEIEHFGYEF